MLEDGGILIFKWFQHTAARRRLETAIDRDALQCLFQHTAARRRLGVTGGYCFRTVKVSTHSRPKAAGCDIANTRRFRNVSTHSRPKAAGKPLLHARVFLLGFNTQPPEGGWGVGTCSLATAKCFNTQPPEGGWSLSQKPCSIRFRSPDFAKLTRKARTRV